MTRSLARQFLVWQLAVVALLLAAVAGFAAVRSDADFRDTQGRRMLSVAEDVAALTTVRDSLVRRHFDPLPGVAVGARNISGADDVLIVDVDGIVRTSADPAAVGIRFAAGESTAASGRAWVGDPDGRTVDAQVPVMDEEQRILGIVAARIRAPSLLEGLAAAPGPALTLLGVALVLGVGGSLLLARRVRRQTLGLEPAEIVELVQRREAMLLGVKEGVVGMDGGHRITLLNDAARDMLGVAVGASVEELDLDARLRDVLLGTVAGEDQLVLRDGKVLVLNRMPVVVHGEQVGAVVTLRDRTELAAMEGRLDASRHVTDTLRAQAHEFANRLHTIAGLTELGEHDEVRRFVAGVVAGGDAWRREVTTAVGDAAAAALLVAKASLAAERGVTLRLTPGAELATSGDDPALSADLVTVLGNLVDNALDAVAACAAPRWVEVGVDGDTAGPVTVAVADSGPGVAPELADEVFRHGFSTKPGREERGLGLALVRQVCVRRGGSVAVTGSTFTAVLPLLVRA